MSVKSIATFVAKNLHRIAWESFSLYVGASSAVNKRLETRVAHFTAGVSALHPSVISSTFYCV